MAYFSLTNGKANSIADADKQMVQQFMAWNHWLDSTQKELEAKATPHQRRYAFDEIKSALNEQNSPDSLFAQLLKIRIKAYARYNETTRKWDTVDINQIEDIEGRILKS